MAKYNLSLLLTLLKLKEQKLKISREECLRLAFILKGREQQLQEIQKEIVMIDSRGSLEYLARLEEHLVKVYEKKEVLYESIAQARKELRIKQREAIEVDRERKIVEKILKLRYDRFRKQEIKKQTALLDDFTIRSYRQAQNFG